jgi:hypothetical protein
LSGLVLLVLAAPMLAKAQGSIRLDGGPSWKGFSIRFATKVEPDGNGASAALGGTVIDLKGGVVGQRFIDDPAHKRSFGYDVRLEPSADGTTVQIRIEPLHAAQHAVQSGWTQFGLPIGLPKYPVIPGLRVGDTVAIDLLRNPVTGEKIVDYLSLERRENPPAELARDFALSDVELTLDRPRVWVNGKLAEASAQENAGTTGYEVWFYLTGYGRYTLSLFPDAKRRSHKAGTVAGKAITFADGSNTFRVQGESRVAPADGVYNVYMRRDTTESLSVFGPFSIGSQDAGAESTVTPAK